MLASLNGHIVSNLYGQRLKRLVFRIFHAILSHPRHQILTHVVVGSQEDFRSHRLQRLLGHALQRLHLVFLAIVLHQRHLVGCGKDALHQFRVVVEQRMLQRHTLGMRERDALFERLAGNLLQQLHLTVLIRQVEVFSQHLADNKDPVEMIGTRDGTSRHQQVAFLRDGRRR